MKFIFVSYSATKKLVISCFKVQIRTNQIIKKKNVQGAISQKLKHKENDSYVGEVIGL